MEVRILGATAFALFAAACTSVKSTDVETSGMSAHMTVTADGQGNTGVNAELNVDVSLTDYVDLSSGDALVATAGGGASQTMSRSDLLGVISYGASFTGQDAPGTAYVVAFDRKAPDVSAPSSTCTIPQPFSLTAPASTASFSRAGDAVVVTYAGSGTSDVMTYLVTGSCVDTASGSVTGDTGTIDHPQGALVQPNGGTSSCTATLTVRRSRSGQLDPAFGYGGGISCDQARTVSFTSTP